MRTKPSTAHLKYECLHLASISRRAYRAIADHPMYPHQQGPRGAKQITVRAALEPTQPHDKRRRALFGAGLMDRVTQIAQSQGIDIRVAKQSVLWSWSDHQPNQPSSEFLVRTDGRLRSLGVVPALAERIRLIAEVCTLRPESHVLVVARTNSDAKAVANRLKSVTDRTPTWGPSHREDHPWLHVTSAQALSSCCTIHWGFIIYLDAELVLSQTATEHLMWSSGSIRIGFLTRDERRLLPYERCFLEALFGEVIYRPGVEWPCTEVSVAWLHPTKKPVHATNTLERKRNQIWRNDARNRLIARAATSLSTANMPALKMIGLHDAARWLSTTDQRPSVAILVENVEHGEHLARLLPGWRLETTGYTPPAGQCVTHDRVIMTLSRAAETLVATSAVIYAAGGADRWPAQVGLVRDAWAIRHMLIVDVDDRHDRLSTDETLARASEYQYLGFHELETRIRKHHQKEET